MESSGCRFHFCTAPEGRCGVRSEFQWRNYWNSVLRHLDETVSDRVLYDILIKAGRVLDLHIPRDGETNKSKGYAFAEYETEEIANYAVKLFSGIITLYNRTLKFAISGQDKQPSQNAQSAIMPSSHSSHQSRPGSAQVNNVEVTDHSTSAASPWGNSPL